MVELEQEEFERLKNFETMYNELKPQHDELVNKHNTLKDDYITLSKGQQPNGDSNKQDEFDALCSTRFKK